MVNRQGAKLVEDVTGIECMEDTDDNTLQCRVVSETSIPTWYNNVEEVDTDNVKLEDQEREDNSIGFDNPVECEIVFGSEYNRIECSD